nr:uncharacterized protein LOC122269702 [Parasteatoda tepidariorum]
MFQELGRISPPCYDAYSIADYDIVNSAIFDSYKYSKAILEAASLSHSVFGLLFIEVWVSNIFFILKLAFECSHRTLVKVLKNKEGIFNSDFQDWKENYIVLVNLSRKADCFLSPLVFSHVLITPVLLCLGGFQLLQMHQELFMKGFDSKAVSYFLIVFCLYRLSNLCFAGDELKAEVTDIANKLLEGEVSEVPKFIRFQLSLKQEIYQAVGVNQSTDMRPHQNCHFSYELIPHAY